MPRHLLGIAVLFVVTAANASTPHKAITLDNPVSASAPAPKALTPSAIVPTQEHRELSETPGKRSSVADEKPVDWFTRIVAFIGVILGIVNIFFSIWKLKRDRWLSVEDDFWFRKIVAPATIEPLLQDVMQLLQEMPTKGSSPDDLSAYARKITTDFQKLYPAMQTLGLIDPAWPKLVIDRLRECEDILTEHIGEIINNDLTQQPGSTELQNSVLKMLNDALHVIKVRHLKK